MKSIIKNGMQVAGINTMEIEVFEVFLIIDSVIHSLTALSIVGLHQKINQRKRHSRKIKKSVKNSESSNN